MVLKHNEGYIRKGGGKIGVHNSKAFNRARDETRSPANGYLGDRQNLCMELKVWRHIMAKIFGSGDFLNELAKLGWTNQKLAEFVSDMLDSPHLKLKERLEIMQLLKQIMSQSEGQKIEIATDDMSNEDLDETILKLVKKDEAV